MTQASARDPDVARRRELLLRLLENPCALLEELAQVCAIQPPSRIHEQPGAVLDELAEFFRRTDFTAATEDGRIWMGTRLGLFIARYFIVRYQGGLEVQDDIARPFYLQYVVGNMELPVVSGARVAPFEIAHAALNAQPKPDLADLVHDAERALFEREPRP